MEIDPAETAKNVFSEGSEAGDKFISYLVQVMDRRDVVLNAPSTDARLSEIRLVESLAHADEVGSERLVEAVSDYCTTHWLYTQAGSEWTKDVPIYWLWAEGKNIACTDIQTPIIAAVWKRSGLEDITWTRI